MSFARDWLAAHPGIAHVEYVVTDPSGIARGKWAPAASLAKAGGEGINFPLSLHALDVWGAEVAETGLHIESGDRDGFYRAISETLSPVAGRPDTAQVLLETFEIAADGSMRPFPGCARQVLKGAVERLAEADLSATCAFELEFHLLRANEAEAPPIIADDPALGDSQRMYALGPLDERYAVLDEIRRAGAAAGLPIDTIVKEAAPGQYEVNLSHRDAAAGGALRAADDAVLLRRIVQCAARAHGCRATFMAKPFPQEAGNGAHVHVSLQRSDGANVFADEEGSERLRHAAGGLVSTMREMSVVFCNTVNGFRRMAPGSYAPTRANWGYNNRSVAVRVPAAKGAARRLEHRVSGADANPYLVLASVIAAMREGLERAVEPPAPLEGNAYDMNDTTGGERLPATMAEALGTFEGSQFARRALGATIHANLVHLKRAEIAGFAHDISPLERATYT